MGISKQEYSSGLSFPCPVDHVLSELSTMTHPSWMALHGMAHGFIEHNKGQKWYGPNKQKILRRGSNNTQKNYIKKIFMTQIIMIM